MDFFNNIKHSISRKLLIRVFSIYFIITLIITFIHMYEEYQYTKKSVYTEVVLLEETFKVPLANAIWDYNIDQRDILLKNVYGISVISGVQLYSKENILLKEYGEVDDTKGEVYSFPLSNSFNGTENWLGYVKLYSKEDVIIDRIKVGFIFIVVNSIIKTLVLWFLLVWIFNKLLSRPLHELTEQVGKIDLDHLENNNTIRKYTLPSKPNELELFKSRFAEMLNKMLISKKQLDLLNRDLDQQVQVKTQKIQESLDDFKTLLNSTIEGVIIFDENRRCVDLNDPVLEIFGYETKEELKGKHILELAHNDSKEIIRSRLNSKDTSSYEIKLLRKNKKVFPALVRGINTTIHGRDMRISAVIDISELKEKESMLLHHTKHAAMGEMIGNIAHQWRQPLSVISTTASGLHIQMDLGRVSDEEIIRSCNVINDTTQYLSKTINEFSNYLRENKDRKSFNLNENIDTFLHFVKGVKQEYCIAFVVNVDKDIMVLGYPSELIQCYISLFHNSKDAFINTKKPLEQRTIFISQYVKNDKVVIEFKDNAGGISEDIIHKVFDPYFTTKHQAQGTGLGLHMVYNLVVNGMGGDVSVINSEFEYNGETHKGAVFTIALQAG